MNKNWCPADRTKVVFGEADKVRIYLGDGENLFCARDILNVCQVNAPEKWLNRNGYTLDSGKVTPLLYPIYGSTQRRIKTYFINLRTAKEIVGLVHAPKDAVAWLETAVFQPYGKAESAKLKNSVHQLSGETVNNKIDRILLELLEIKKAVVEARYSL